MYSTYCSQMDGNCEECGLVSYGRDCKNNPVARDVTAGRCHACDRPVVFCEHAENYYAAKRKRINQRIEEDTWPRATQTEINAFFGG